MLITQLTSCNPILIYLSLSPDLLTIILALLNNTTKFHTWLSLLSSKSFKIGFCSLK